VDGSWDRADFRAYWHRQQQLAGPERELAVAWQAQEWERALEVVRRMRAIDPESPRYQVQEFALLVGGVNRPEEGYKLGEQLMTEYWHEPSVLNYLAWIAAAGDNVAKHDLDFALKAATRACEMMNWGEGGMLDTLARVYYERGDLETALKWQREAVKYPQNEQAAAQLNATLERYEAEAAEG
jgi:tetratricopeptide (TPR) repeat protein